MSASRKPSHSGRNAGKQQAKASGGKQVFQIMLAVLILFAFVAGVTFLMLFLSDRLNKDPEQTHEIGVMEANTAYTRNTTETTTTPVSDSRVTGVMFDDEETTKHTTNTTLNDTELTTTTRDMTPATAPPPVTKQPAIVYTSAGGHKTTTTTSATTHSTTAATTTDASQPMRDSYNALWQTYQSTAQDSAPVYAYKDINGDSIPEMLISGGSEPTDRSHVYTYSGGNTVVLLNEYGALTYAKQEQYLILTHTQNGIKKTVYYVMENNALRIVHAFTENENGDGYMIDGAVVSVAEYQNAMALAEPPTFPVSEQL